MRWGNGLLNKRAPHPYAGFDEQKKGPTVQLNVLDHGYVRFIESWGSDERVIEAARMSTNKGFVGWDTDEKLLAYLYNNKHATPFEMAGMVIEVKAPIFVFREWHRHRTQSYNEMSARYIPLPDENYAPDLFNILERVIQPTGNKQEGAVTTKIPTSNEVGAWLCELTDAYAQAQRVYERGLQLGIPKELARLPVPVARYSRMRASANLRNWLAFLTLRTAPNAQREIRSYAAAVEQLVSEHFPRTWKLFAKEQQTHASK
jgi:thymidylate synthase (FAD)